MNFSQRSQVLIVDLKNSSPQLETLKTILEAGSVDAVVADLREPPNQHTLVTLCNEYQPSLVIQLFDASELDQIQKGGGLPACLTVPLIVAAQNLGADQIRTMLDCGASDFIAPPFTAESILPRVWRLLKYQATTFASTASLQQRMAMQRLGLVGESRVFVEEIEKLKLLARCDITVMIGGETGTGKELVARAVHYLSPRCDRPFVAVDCGAIPPELTESELFGHERGAFTGAVAKNPGLISAANHGTLFLDEVDALTLTVQAKLLRFLQEMEYRSLGSTEIKKADVRIISATNRDLHEHVAVNQFRKDLYYRLNVVQLNLPSLRQRREDIVLLARHFATKHAVQFGRPRRDFAPAAIQKLITHHWPGNVRELENVVAAAVALCDEPLICANDLLLAGDKSDSPSSFRDAKARVIVEFEREYIMRVLNSCDGNVSQAARVAGKNRRAFWELIRKHRIDVRERRNTTDRQTTALRARSGGLIN
jgi:two-component system, NtrC family, response regulator GlrR